MLTLRAEKGSPLTWQELDQNFKFTPRTDKYVTFLYELSDTGSTAVSASADYTLPLNVMNAKGLSCSLDSNQFSVPAGQYFIIGAAAFYRCGYTMVYLVDNFNNIYATSTEGMAGQLTNSGQAVYGNSFNFLHAVATIPAAVTLRLSARFHQAGTIGVAGLSPSYNKTKHLIQLTLYKLD